MIPNQIRLDAGYITLRDLDSHPSWEPCLDEVGVDDQTECTIRPFKPKTASLRLTDYCLVACDFITRRKRTFVGWITLGTSNTISPWNLTPEIMLDGIDESVSSDPNANSIQSVVCTTEATTVSDFPSQNHSVTPTKSYVRRSTSRTLYCKLLRKIYFRSLLLQIKQSGIGPGPWF